VRFTLAALAAQGRDIKLAASRVEGYRNFATKLWNAMRFCLVNGCAPVAGYDPAACRLTLDRWIVGEVAATAGRVEEAVAAYRFNDAAHVLYHFVWHELCDWFIEFSKPVMNGEDAADAAEARATAAWALGQTLHLLHPFMPFLTEELWPHVAGPAERDGM